MLVDFGYNLHFHNFMIWFYFLYFVYDYNIK